MASLPLTTSISQSSSRKRAYRTLTSQFGDGYEQDAPDGTNNIIDTWTINYENLNITDRNTLVAFLDSQGGWTTWTWQAINDTVVKNWKITKDGWSETVVAGNISSISFTATQVY